MYLGYVYCYNVTIGHKITNFFTNDCTLTTFLYLCDAYLFDYSMRKSIYSALLWLLVAQFCAAEVEAQVRVARSEFVCYDRREDANKDIRTGIEKHIVIAPMEQFRSDDGKVRAVYEQKIDIPATWQDYNAYLHLEKVGGDYTIFFNGEQITPPIDKYTPVDLFVSPYLVQGENVFAVVMVEEIGRAHV